ncbi:MAG: dihydrolipoyl dehydrogenase [Candidatus Thermoplasmatota archaeon]|nr:dihydrolipoyl dehydrogenase [Candidatus Thermoplasmatota archaeon]
MAEVRNCKVLVVGAGPGGYVAAIRAGQLGLDTIIVEGSRAGGTCLIRGCIPSKAMIHAASTFESLGAHSGKGKMGISVSGKPKVNMKELVTWKESIVNKLNKGVETLLKAAKVELISGWAKFRNAKTCEVSGGDKEYIINAEHVILANGSQSVELPFMPFDNNVISSTEALELDKVPKKLVVIGAGYIGLELGMAYRKLGSEVTFIEALDQILPIYDSEMTRPINLWLKKHKVIVNLGAKAKGAVTKGKVTTVEYVDSSGKNHKIKADKVLVTVGRKPNTQGWGLEKMAVDMEGPFIKVDKQCRTSMKNVWAIGDIVGEPMLAHKASAQAEMVSEIIAGHKREFDPVSIAAVCFTDPEIVGVGLTPDEAKEEGIETIVGKFPFAASGRALAMDAGLDGGFVRITARKDNQVIVGIHAVGSHVSELSGEFALALEMGARLDDIAGTIHVHPTLTEAFAESALASLGHAIHISN